MTARKRSVQKKPDHLGWKPSCLLRRDGKGCWNLGQAQVQFLHWPSKVPYWHPEFQLLVPYGVAQMDNGEIILVGAVGNDKSEEKTVVTISGDGGDTWAPLRRIGRSVMGRPMSLTYLGAGEVMFATGYDDAGKRVRFFSKDYGRTWRERVALPVNVAGIAIVSEGSYLVDRDDDGMAKRIAGFGIMAPEPKNWPFDGYSGGLHWSEDGGRTWSEPTIPKE